jgi:hypothetical protein
LATLGSILDAGDTYSDISADGTRIIAGNNIGGIGSINPDALDVTLGTISALAETGGIGLVEADDILIGSVSVSLARRDDDGNLMTITDATLSDLTTGTNGSILLVSTAGTITITDGADADGLGISAGGTGSVSIIAGVDVVQVADGDIATNGGTLQVEAANDVVMADGAVSSTSDGDILVSAGNDVTLGSLNAGSGSVLIKTATGDVLDGGDTDIDVIADGLAIDAGANIGVVGVGVSDAIDTSVNVLAASSDTGYINILETDDVIIDTVTVTVQQINAAALPTTFSASQSDLITDAGTLILMTVDGSITVNAGLPVTTNPAEAQATALILATESRSGVSSNSGNVLLDAQGADSDLVLNADVITNTGGITLIASDNVQHAATTAVESTDGTIYIDAVTGAVQMADGSQTQTVNGDIRISAGTDIAVANISTVTGSVSLVSQTVSDAGDTDIDISAPGILIRTGGDIGGIASTGIETLEIDATVLTARSVGGNILVQDVNDLIIGAVSVVVQRAQADGTLLTINDTQTGVTTGGTGQVQLMIAGALQMEETTAITTDAGAISLTTGGDANISSIRSNAGAVTIVSGGAILDSLTAVVDGVEVDNIVTGGDLTLVAVSGIGTQADDLNISVRALTASNALIGDINITASGDLIINTVSNASADGSVTLTAENNILQNGLISAIGGSVTVASINGGITMQGAARTETISGNILISANSDVLLTVVSSQTGAIMIVSRAGNILDNLEGDGSNLITGGSLMLFTGGNIGADGAPLKVDASFLNVLGFNGENIFIKFANGKELKGSFQTFYAIATMRYFEPSLAARAVLTPRSELFVGEFDKRGAHMDVEQLMRLLGQLSDEEIVRLMLLAGSALASDARLLLDMLRTLAGNLDTVSDYYNMGLADSLAAVERQLVLLRAVAAGSGSGVQEATTERDGKYSIETPTGEAEKNAVATSDTAPKQQQPVMG